MASLLRFGVSRLRCAPWCSRGLHRTSTPGPFGTALTAPKVRFSGLTDWWQDPHFMGLGVVWFYVTDILMSVASNYIIPKLPKVWLDVRARNSTQEVRSRHAAHARPSHTVAAAVAAVTATTAGVAAAADGGREGLHSQIYGGEPCESA